MFDRGGSPPAPAPQPPSPSLAARLSPRRLPPVLMGLAAARPWLVLTVAGLAVLASLFAASRVRVETDLLSLVPETDPVVSAYRETLERFGSTDLMLIAVRVEGDLEGDREAAYAYADGLAATLRDSPLLAWLEYRLDELERALPELVPLAPLYMEPDDLEAFLGRLATEEGLALSAAELRASLRSPAAFGLEELHRVDPFGMVKRAAERLPQGDGGGLADRVGDGGYLQDPAGTLLLMLAKPVSPPADLPFSRRLAAALEGFEAAAEEEWRAQGYRGARPTVLWASGHLVGVGDTSVIVRDLLLGTGSALLAVVLLFAVAFGRRVAVLIAFVPLVSGLILTFGFAAVALGRLSSVTTAFAALLIGLGIDFVIVLYGRYAEEREAGRSHRQAIDVIGRSTALGVLLGAVTTAATFYAFLTSDFRGLWELGLLTGTGILILLLTVLLLLPALLELAERRRQRRGALRGHRLRGFGARWLFRWSARRPRRTLAVTLALAAVLGAVAYQWVELDDDSLALRSGDNPALLARQQIVDAFGLRFTPYLIRIDAADEHQAMARAREVEAALEPLTRSGAIARVESIAGLLPAAALQESTLARLQAFDAGGLRGRLESALRTAGLNPVGFKAGLDATVAAVERRVALEPSELERGTLGHLLERYLAHDPATGAVSTVLYAYPPPEVRLPPAALVELADARPWVSLTGGIVVSQRLREIVWRDALLAAALGTVIVFLFLALDLGGARRAGMALLPLGVGLVCMLGGMALVGVSVNSMNLFVFTMIIGIGVDYGIHLIHRWSEESLADAEGVAAAVAVAALTTVCGFGSLVFSHFPGLQSMGAAAILGTVAAALVSITLLPALLARIEARRGDPPAADDG